jgi:hypothetical protein
MPSVFSRILSILSSHDSEVNSTEEVKEQNLPPISQEPIMIPTYRVEGDFDGRCICDLNIHDYVELTASPWDIPKDDSRPVYYIDLFEIAGGHAKTPSGGKRYDNYQFLSTGSSLRLFHHVTNRHDKNAIAVFSGNNPISEDDILGYVPQDFNKDVLNAYNRGLLIEAYVSYIKEWFKDRDVNEVRPQYNANMVIKGFPKADAGFDDILYSRCHLSRNIIESMFSVGLNCSASIRKAPDKQILAIKGIGHKLLQRVRELFPKIDSDI